MGPDKRVRGPGAEPSVGGVGGNAPHEPGGLRGRSRSNIKTFLSYFFTIFFFLKFILSTKIYLFLELPVTYEKKMFIKI